MIRTHTPFKIVYRCILLSLAILFAGCSIQPVSPWEKGNLANKAMLGSSSEQYSALQHHAYGSKEGTMGGYGVGGGGCGCN